MKMSKRVQAIKESPTLAILAKANLMKKNGDDIVILAAGEPDCDTPDFIKQAAIDAMNKGYTKYTAVGGIPQLKEAIVRKIKRENNLDYTTSQVLVSCGGKHSIFNMIQALIDDGDEVLIPAPYWVSYPDMVLLAGGKPVIVECGVEDNYKITPNKMRSAINSNTKLIFLNSPSNPTGMIYSAAELRAIADVLLEHPQLMVMTDDIYEHIIFSGDKFVNILNVAPELASRVVIINGVSKSYSMTGWRIGYALGDAKLIKAMDNIQSQSTSNPNSIAQYAAIAALDSGNEPIKPMVVEFIKRHKYVHNALNNIKGVRHLPAAGAFYAFFDCSVAIDNLYNKGKIGARNDMALASYLLEKYFVATVPGSAFGLDNHLRISFATSMAELEKALVRITDALNI